MARYLSIHPTHPQPRLVAQAAEVVRNGGVIAYPTDSSYALGCQVGDRAAVDRIRRIRGIDERHLLSLVCRNLSEIARYARIDDRQFRFLKRGTPGAFTFLLPATREVPRGLVHRKRRTIGIRVPGHPVTLALLEELDVPLVSSTMTAAPMAEPMQDPEAIREQFDRLLDAIVDGGICDGGATTVIDLTTDPPQIVREGRGELARLGLERAA
jgi:tRNA threonylcarbamoyl adenosine modification protein (Sua5/YciO/YrdC/YwlC family)